MKKRALLIGGFQKSRFLAGILNNMGYRVTIVNANHQHCLELAQMDFVTVIHGDGTKPDILQEAGAQDAELAIALTSKDADNLVACQLCKKKFHGKRTVALVNDPKKTTFFYQMGVDSVICAVSSIARVIEQQQLLHGIATLVPIREGRLNIAEVPIAQNAPIAGKKIWEIDLPHEVIIGCVLRGEQSIVPRGDTRVLAGDVLILISSDKQEMPAIRKLTGRS
ncbi:MAG: NAD-binding protein [Clostridiales bacterium]